MSFKLSIGKLAFAGVELFTNEAIAALPIRQPNRVLGEYLYYALKSLRFPRADRAAKGLTLNREKLARLQIPVPFVDDRRRSLLEQKRLAEILATGDAIRRRQRESYEVADCLIGAAFVGMFGDPVSNTKKHKMVPITRYGDVTTGNTPSRDHPEYFGTSIEWIKSDNINTPWHVITRAEEGLSVEGRSIGRIVPSGSTLITCIAGSADCVGNTAFTDRPVAFNQQINAITPARDVDPHFLYTLILLSKPLIQKASTDSMKGMVTKGKLQQVQVIGVPPDQQVEYGQRFRSILSLLEKQRHAISDADDLFASLAQRAFKGEV